MTTRIERHGLLRERRLALTIVVVLMAVMGAQVSARAAQIKIPLEIDYLALGAAMKQQLYTADRGRADLWHGRDDCQYLYVENPRFGRRDSALTLDTDGELSLGVALAGRCLKPLGWSGIAEAETASYASGLTLKLRVADVNLYGKDHRKSVIVGRGFDLIKSRLIPRLETFSYDLTPAVRQLAELAQLAAPPDASARVRDAMATLRLEPQIAAEEDDVRVTLDLMVPESAPLPTAAAPPLTPAEVAAWQKMLANCDAFFVFAIKQLGMTVESTEVRSDLFGVLIDGRERLVDALAQPPKGAGPDPTRVLFLEEWNRLRAIIKQAAQRGMLGNRALEFLSFISAGDALFALDQAAPALGLRVSADDLRRLARIMAPDVTADPLTYSFDEDPELRKIFGISGPLETAGPLIAPDEAEAPDASPDSDTTPEATPPTPGNADAPHGNDSSGPHSAATSQPGARVNPLSRLARAFGAIGPCSADAAESGPAAMLIELGRGLRGVVADERNADRYRMRVSRLLGLSAQREIDGDALQPQYRRLYPVLVKAVAWQESCWRQFVVRRRRIWYLESKTGDIGLMQVNKYVWRGFYSLPRLRWDIVYNCGAGSEILTKMLSGALRRANKGVGGDPDALARSAYAAYNGGPGAYNRWRTRAGSVDARAADDGFWLKFRAMSEGQSFDIVHCAADWDRARGQ